MLIRRNSPSTRYRTVEHEKAVPCPVCDSLQCLCRPRFFAGQLLTEEDLNRLDRYIREKHRLHNRHLHGWGVVNGLEVTCRDCDEKIDVSAGYALSPCGDDIVVCEDDSVDVCRLIQKCRKQERECRPPRRYREECTDTEETWVVAICYDEKPSRGITALRRSGCCACGGKASSCGCGGTSSSCGCQNHANGNGAKNGASSTARRTPLQCEPTVICEGYRFEVYKAGPTDDDEQGALAERFQCCSRPYLDFATELGSSFSGLGDASPSELRQLCCTMRNKLREILLAHPRHDCTLLDTLDRIRCSDDVPQNAFLEIINVWVRGLLACICSVLLPPGPELSTDNCVPLATVTVTRPDCRVLKVCNWTIHRKFATTFPSLQYWLSIFPFGRLLRDLIERLCCEFPDLLVRDVDSNFEEAEQPFDTTFDPTRARTMDTMPFTSARSRAFSNLAFASFTGRTTELDPETLFKGVMGLRREDETPFLKQQEREHLPQYLLLDQLARPFGLSLVPDDLLKGGLAAASRQPGEVAALRNQVSEMQSRIEEQQSAIDALRERLENQ